MIKPIWIGGCLALIMTGCGEISYKRGASAQDLERARKGCAQTGSEDAQLACLREAGWIVAPIGDSELFAQAHLTKSQPHADTQPDNVMDSNTMPLNKRLSLDTETTQKQVNPEAKQGASNPKPAQTLTAPSPASVQPPDAHTPYAISSWWKFGGTPNLLKQDKQACEATLGESHKTNEKAQIYTRGFVICMHQKGWKGLKANKT